MVDLNARAKRFVYAEQPRRSMHDGVVVRSPRCADAPEMIARQGMDIVRSTEIAPTGDVASHQGRLTSPTLLELMRRGVERRVQRPIDANADKTTQLRAVLEEAGASAVFDLGLDIRSCPPHPLLDVLVAAESATALLERWMRFERFGHTRNRTRIRQPADGDVSRLGVRHAITVEHVAIDDGPIDPVNDLFIWGVLVGLVERAGFTGVSAQLALPDGAWLRIYSDQQVEGFGDVPPETNTLQLTCDGVRQTLEANERPQADSASMSHELGRLFETDLLRTWRLAEVARQLCLSTRQLQRKLTRERTSFSQTLRRTRIEAAHALMRDTSLTLTEIAYCAGFSDSAHFTRIFREYADVPPSALRTLPEA